MTVSCRQAPSDRPGPILIQVQPLQQQARGTAERIRANLSSLSPAERRVADVVLRDPVAVIHLSVSELGALAQSSASSVVRMCSSLGLRGFQELKILLARESIPAEKQLLEAIAPGDKPSDVARKVIAGTAMALDQAAAVVDVESIARIVDILRGVRRVQFGAAGTSAPVQPTQRTA